MLGGDRLKDVSRSRGSVWSGQSETAGELGRVLLGDEQTAIITESAASDICDVLVSP